MQVGFLNVLSALFGWVYTLSWSLSFYPQPILNWRRKSTSGTTIDFPFINTLGFLAYLISNAAFYYSPVVRAQYAARNNGHHPAVAFNDIAFAAHALLLSLITASQYFFPRLWRFAATPGTRISRFILGTAIGCVLGVFVVILRVQPDSDSTRSVDPQRDWVWLDVVYAVGYVKLWVTLIKFTPQILANFRNKSTAGWSISQILLDFVGGTLSIAQLLIDSYLQGDWSGLTGNPVKFALGQVSMIYDLIFFAQHYVLYREPGGMTGEREALLERGDEQRGYRQSHGRTD
ncbi:PQ loop repeat-domain-containing protein [Coniella lustricola]|uniref:PQ loop repeat-domain-containing protein n=1 Tax=Coniella lustricola TaxID=2025994 RepID=A0A2T3AF28_9PEZI|nr:PQ loop repeat-domain-containing protein [Coniella lustricola]